MPMRLRNRHPLLFRAAACSALLLSAAPATPATPTQPALIGLVIGNSNYSAFPKLSACLESSQRIANTLRSLGFRVIAREDVTAGAFDAAIGEFSRGMEANPDASAFVYICGYVAGMGNRPFLLPVSANIGRPSDVMTQGVLAKAILDVLDRGKPTSSVVALDLAPIPDESALALDTLTALPVPAGTGLIAVTESQPTTGPTPLSAALVGRLTTAEVHVDALLTGVKAELGKHPSAKIDALRIPSVSRAVAANEEPPPEVPAPAEPAQTAAKIAGQSQLAAPTTTPVPALPDEGEMTDDDRRRVQEALARVGYYDAAIDGLFGPETRAAIRRFQHEIGVEMTGVITGAQATRLLTGY